MEKRIKRIEKMNSIMLKQLEIYEMLGDAIAELTKNQDDFEKLKEYANSELYAEDGRKFGNNKFPNAKLYEIFNDDDLGAALFGELYFSRFFLSYANYTFDSYFDGEYYNR